MMWWTLAQRYTHEQSAEHIRGQGAQRQRRKKRVQGHAEPPAQQGAQAGADAHSQSRDAIHRRDSSVREYACTGGVVRAGDIHLRTRDLRG